jgi:hypothetical protein
MLVCLTHKVELTTDELAEEHTKPECMIYSTLMGGELAAKQQAIIETKHVDETEPAPIA